MIDRKALIAAAASRFGAPYLFGAKWDLKDSNPKGPVDCSGFTRWCYAQIGIDIPEGSTNQHEQSVKESFVLPGDLVFLKDAYDDGTHHVGLVYNQDFIIEARGHFYDVRHVDIGQSVLLRPRSEWEARSDFLGCWRPRAVTLIEGA